VGSPRARVCADEALDPAEALHHKIVSVVESCLPFMRTALYSNIVLSGNLTPRALCVVCVSWCVVVCRVAYSSIHGVRACIGGNTLFAGFPERLEKELKALLPDQYQQCVKVKAQPERRHQYGPLPRPHHSLVGLVTRCGQFCEF
jgi:hypothetical protein